MSDSVDQEESFSVVAKLAMPKELFFPLHNAVIDAQFDTVLAAIRILYIYDDEVGSRPDLNKLC